MLEKLGKGLAFGVLLASGCGGPEVGPDPIETVDIVRIIPDGANFYEEPVFSEKVTPCGIGLGILLLKQTRHAREEVKDVPNVGNVTIEYLGFSRESVFPAGSDPNNSCAKDKDGIVWTNYFIVPSSPPSNK